MVKNFLKKIRTEKNITATMLAEKTGIKRQTIWGFENEKHGVSQVNLIKIGKVLGVNPTYIITGEEGVEISSETNRKKMEDSMSLALEFYGKDYDKEALVKIASSLYSIMTSFEDLTTNEEKTVFRKDLQNKFRVGLAAKCFLDSITF